MLHKLQLDKTSEFQTLQQVTIVKSYNPAANLSDKTKINV